MREPGLVNSIHRLPPWLNGSKVRWTDRLEPLRTAHPLLAFRAACYFEIRSLPL
jgi:hypothetical protein